MAINLRDRSEIYVSNVYVLRVLFLFYVIDCLEITGPNKLQKLGDHSAGLVIKQQISDIPRYFLTIYFISMTLHEKLSAKKGDMP